MFHATNERTAKTWANIFTLGSQGLTLTMDGSEWILWCLLKSRRSEKDLGQWGQTNGRSPVWILSCFRKFDESEKHLRQKRQTNGRSFVWMRSCLIRCDGYEKVLGQNLQLSKRSQVWFRSCLFNSVANLNALSQNRQENIRIPLLPGTWTAADVTLSESWIEEVCWSLTEWSKLSWCDVTSAAALSKFISFLSPWVVKTWTSSLSFAHSSLMWGFALSSKEYELEAFRFKDASVTEREGCKRKREEI